MRGPWKSSGRRQGFLLVEVLAAMAAGVVVTGVTIAVLVAVIRVDRRFARRIEGRRSTEEFAERLRGDVHSATSVDWDADARELRLFGPDGLAVIYRAAADRWERFVRRGDDEQLWGAFRLPRNMDCRVDVDKSLDAVLVIFTWVSNVEPHDPTRRKAASVEVVAATGRDWELLYP
jgi:hypothetical protein